jgi:hypothetical protein
MRSRFKPEPNLEILGTNRFDAYQEGPDGKEVEIQGGKFYFPLRSYKIILAQEVVLALTGIFSG